MGSFDSPVTAQEEQVLWLIDSPSACAARDAAGFWESFMHVAVPLKAERSFSISIRRRPDLLIIALTHAVWRVGMQRCWRAGSRLVSGPKGQSLLAEDPATTGDEPIASLVGLSRAGPLPKSGKQGQLLFGDAHP